MTTCKVVDKDGILIAVVSAEERNRLLGRNEDGTAPRMGDPDPPLFPEGVPLFDPPLIQSHRKLSKIFYSLVDAAVIRAELRRDISRRVPVAEDCVTTQKTSYSNDKGSGRYFEHHDRRSLGYPTTQAASRDRNARRLLREQRTAVKVMAQQRAAYFPIREAS